MSVSDTKASGNIFDKEMGDKDITGNGSKYVFSNVPLILGLYV